MIDYHKNIVQALSDILPTYYEYNLKNQATPCISYMELNSYDDKYGDTIGYSRIQFQVKVWDTSLANIQSYAKRIDLSLRSLGFHRVSSGELHDNNSAMIQKILTYQALGLEDYTEV